MAKLLHQGNTDFLCSEFQGFGNSIITKAARKQLHGMTIPAQRLEARKYLRQYLPAQPGVYGWLDQNSQLIYVGKSKSLRTRLLSYFDKQTPDPKMERIRQHSQSVVWEITSHELLALIREQELIVRFRPSMNVQGQPHRRQPGFVCFSKNIAPKAYLARKLKPGIRGWYGPISGTGELNAAITSLNYVFKLRDCPDSTRFQFNNHLLLFDKVASAKCLRFELATCPAPCVAACSQRNYAENVQRAVEFMDGDHSVLSQLEQEMNVFARKQAFEKAIVLRDQLSSLTWLSRRLKDLREAEQLLNGIYELPGLGNRPIWLWLRRGEMIGCLAKSKQTPKSVRDQFQLDGESTQVGHDILSTYLKILLMSWFRKNPTEKARLLEIQQPQKSVA